MVNTVHVAVAAAIVRIIPDPGYAWPLAIGSHIALDTIPHWNWHPNGSKARVLASAADIVIAAGVSFWLATISQHFWVTIIACFLAMVPDLIQGPYYAFNWRPGWLQRFINWESMRQKWPWMKAWMGILTQVATLVVAVLVLLSIK